ncbi:interleukin-8-like [Clupea harengus]|uniref:Interleukin-8-like n=1 Tax=Clupea harengus TaxID=7950 RepID=A0A6P3VRC4_CLUHA|nr:interleukin-8-like [Clupea harengus]
MNAIFTVSLLIIAIAAMGTESATIPGLRCKCIKNAPSNEIIPEKYVKKIDRFPASPLCNKEEAIIHGIKGKQRCVDPTAKWVKNLEKAIQLKAAAAVNRSNTLFTPETTTAHN